HLARGTDLRALFEELDGERTFNLIDAILEEDVLRGADLQENGLEKIRTAIMSAYKETPVYGTPSSAPAGLHSGRVLQEQTDEDGNYEGVSPFAGLREAPVG